MKKLPAEPLAYVFAELWDAFVDSVPELDGAHIETIIERTGLAAWRAANELDVKISKGDLEVGDAILCLTPEGLDTVTRGRETR